MWATINRPKRSGFTIVELLIVIVVIAILAAITIVAYNGIQDRANRAQTSSSLEAYAKVLSEYTIDNGAYPIASGCLGKASNCLNVANTGATCFGLGISHDNPALDALLVKYFGSNAPVPSSSAWACGTGQYGGAYYYSVDGKNAYLYTVFSLNSGCPSIGGITVNASSNQDSTQYCRYILPVLS